MLDNSQMQTSVPVHPQLGLSSVAEWSVLQARSSLEAAYRPPLGLKLKKSPSQLEWFRQQLAEQELQQLGESLKCVIQCSLLRVQRMSRATALWVNVLDVCALFGVGRDASFAAATDSFGL